MWVKVLKKVAYTTKEEPFNEQMNKMVTGLSKAAEFFTSADPVHWANCRFPGPRWGQMTNNTAESFNHWIKGARHLPIVAMIDTIRVQTMDKFNERRQKGSVMKKSITPFYDKLLLKNFDKGRKYTISVSTRFKYECRFENRVYDVNLEQTSVSCSCGRLQLFRYPCSHACACISIAGRRVYEYCDPYYQTSTYRNTYVPSINTIPTFDRPDITLRDCQIKPPETKRQLGCRRVERIPSQVITRPLKCGRCRKHGHNRRSCKNPIGEVRIFWWNAKFCIQNSLFSFGGMLIYFLILLLL